MTAILQIISHSETETQGLAAKMVPAFRPDDLVVLTGPLGAGKTAFVRGLAKAMGLDEDNVNSPSYTIINEYPGEKPLYHFDLYRLGDSSELVEIGWDDYLEKNGLVVVEWGEMAGEYLPDKYYQIKFEIIDDTQRQIYISLISNE